MLLDLGFTWVSSFYPPHPVGEPLHEPTDAVLDAIVAAQAKAQPFVYPSGLIEVPMSPISDIGAFRNGRWKLEWFLEAIRRGGHVGDRPRRGVRLPRPPVVPVRHRSQVSGDRDDLRPGPQGRRPGRAGRRSTLAQRTKR